jgi:single-strand DNA-binding protein
LWRGLADVAEKYVKKGMQLYVEGKIKSRTYDDKDGNKRYITEIYGDSMRMLTTKDTGGPSSENNTADNSTSTPSNYQEPDVDDSGGEEDDLPF